LKNNLINFAKLGKVFYFKLIISKKNAKIKLEEKIILKLPKKGGDL